jgi:hypothetical protein
LFGGIHDKAQRSAALGGSVDNFRQDFPKMQLTLSSLTAGMLGQGLQLEV